MRQKIANLIPWLIPTVCVLCHQYHHNTLTICLPCRDLFVPIGMGCRICRLPLSSEHFLECGHCIKHKPAFDTVFTAYCFEEPLRRLLHEFKYQQGLHLRNLMTQLMLDALPSDFIKPDCLIPVPMHPDRIRIRGFNQSAELARLLAKKQNIPLSNHLCTKTINTPAQASLNAQSRRQNLKGVFHAKLSKLSHVMLIDDLLTTGSTVNELAHTLKQQGVAKVDVWCLARATIK